MLRNVNQTIESIRAASNGKSLLHILWQAAALICLLLMFSPLWVESDAYRFGAGLLLLAAVCHYFLREFGTKDQVDIGPMGFFCIGWAAFVAIRFALAAQANGSFDIGGAEGVFMFSFVYPTTGYVFWLHRKRLPQLFACIIAISFFALVISIDFNALLNNTRWAKPWPFNNTIHAALAAAFILILMFHALYWLWQKSAFQTHLGKILAALALATFYLAALKIFYLNSKGVWLALGGTGALMLFALKNMNLRMLIFAAISLSILGIMTFTQANHIARIAGPTWGTATNIIENIAQGDGILPNFRNLIADPATPSSAQIRLMLWHDALTLIQANPILGLGPDWKGDWANREFFEYKGTLMHNGYLEIALRHGLLGIGFYIVLYSWVFRQLWLAQRAGLVPNTVCWAIFACSVLFCFSLLSNSNNRLAIGEAFMLIWAASGFYAQYALQDWRKKTPA